MAVSHVILPLRDDEEQQDMRMTTSKLLICVLSSLFFAAAAAVAEVRLPALFSDNMVLQREAKVPIWGTAEPGETVTVTLGDQRVTGSADSQGRWKVELSPLATGGPFEMTISGKNKLTLHNVVVGEVWICSGQSNMEMAVASTARALGGVRNADQEIAAANFPMIRQFAVKRAVAGQPQDDMQGQWVAASPQTAGEFTATGFFFARELHKTLGVPIGLINSSWGGTPAEAWTRAAALAAEPALASIGKDWEQKLADYPKLLEKFRQELDEWHQASLKADAEGKPAPPAPQFPADPRSNPWRPAGLFNGMIEPLIPYGIRGVIWYQGESNAGRAYQYRKLFPVMIQDWRRVWGQGDFPFLFVQLAGFMQNSAPNTAWAELREAQLMTLSLPKTGMAVAADIGEPYDIHPRNKQEVGRRLALAAQAIAYGKNVTYSGPIYESKSLQGNKIRLRFKHASGGLVAKGGERLRGFEIAGEDRKFVSAEARIEGDTVVVHSDKVPHPVAVRYAWADYPECSLYNRADLPASPFRTDDWPGVTADSR
jgi:sialate O-acetylesterase